MDENGPELFINYGFDVTLVRIIGNMFVPSYLKVQVMIERGETASDHDIELVLTKWKFYFDSIISKSIVFSSENDQAIDILVGSDGISKTSNVLMLSPEDPSDEAIASLFQAKMNALGKGHLVVYSLEISSDNMNGLSFALVGDHSLCLPATIEDYLGGESFWEVPWWDRDDASSLDVLKPEGDVPVPSWAYSLDFLDRTQTKSVLSRSSFRPHVINGGKPV